MASETGNPFFDAWMSAGRRFAESGWLGTLGNLPLLSELTSRTEESWQLC